MEKVWIHGVSGRMGNYLKAAIEDHQKFTLAGGSSMEKSLSSQAAAAAEANLYIDFSLPKANLKLLDWSKNDCPKGKTFLIATTGLSTDALKEWQALGNSGQHRVMVAPNTSLGVLVMARCVSQLSPLLTSSDFDVELVETHHRYKKDSPSGTALFLADHVRNSTQDLQKEESPKGERNQNRIGIHAIRGGGVFGEHEVRFISPFEELTLSHRALSRELFANGALTLAGWLLQKDPGYYEYTEVLPEVGATIQK